MHFYTVYAEELKTNNNGMTEWERVINNPLDNYFLAIDMESAKGYILSLLQGMPRFPITKEPEWNPVKLDPSDSNEDAMDWVQRLEDRQWAVEINEREYMNEMIEHDQTMAVDFLIQLWKRHPDDKVITRG